MTEKQKAEVIAIFGIDIEECLQEYSARAFKSIPMILITRFIAKSKYSSSAFFLITPS
jgi:hypothetical protein